MDLKMSKGKTATQVAHASVDAVLQTDKKTVQSWQNDGAKKVVLKVDGLAALKQYLEKAKKGGVVCALISDAGRTHLEPGTTTCLAIGPDDEDKLDTITGDLKLL